MLIIVANIYWRKNIYFIMRFSPHLQLFYFSDRLEFCEFFEWKIKRINNADLFSQTPFLTFIKGANISGGHCKWQHYIIWIQAKKVFENQTTVQRLIPWCIVNKVNEPRTRIHYITIILCNIMFYYIILHYIIFLITLEVYYNLKFLSILLFNFLLSMYL